MRTGRGEKIGVPGKNVFQKLKGKMISPEPRAGRASMGRWGQSPPSLPGRGSHRDNIQCLWCRVGTGKPKLLDDEYRR